MPRMLPPSGRGDVGLVENPGQRDLGRLHAALGGDLADDIGDAEVGLPEIEVAGEIVALRAGLLVLSLHHQRANSQAPQIGKDDAIEEPHCSFKIFVRETVIVV